MSRTQPTEKVAVLGRTFDPQLPDFAAREELVVAYNEAAEASTLRRLRVFAAMIGLCTPLGREASADYFAVRCDVLRYGGIVYSHLREKGTAPKEIAEAGITLLLQLAESLAPREEEVAEAADFTARAGEP